jgi:hypothetical protein
MAGLSSSFALCVSACGEPTQTRAAHSCHEQTTDRTIAADTGTCSHSPSIASRPDLSRDDRAPLVWGEAVTFARLPLHGSEQPITHPRSVLPDHNVAASPILRI